MSKQGLESKFYSLDKKVLTVSLSAITLLCIVSSIISRFLQEKMETENLNKEVSYFQTVVLPSITDSIWKMDFDQARVQLQGLLTNPNFARVLIQDFDEKKDCSFGCIKNRTSAKFD